MIRFANTNDIDPLMKFINDYWKENHILARDRNFFNYEHCYEDTVNFVISLDDRGNINGMQGFIPYGKHNRDITKNLWRALKSDVPHLGSKILDFLIKNSDARTVASIGSNPKTLNIYRRIGFHVGELSQWYRLGKGVNYIISDITNSFIPDVRFDPYDWVELDSFKEFQEKFDFNWYQNSGMIPYKEPWYIEKRYYHHPIYHYSVYGVEGLNGIRLALVFRIENYSNSKALRLIDCIGDYNDLRFVTRNIDALMMDIGAEYADIYESGIDQDAMVKAGWIKVQHSGNIIPNYFSPYEKKNIRIHYASSSSDAIYFKGDGDQDRPS